MVIVGVAKEDWLTKDDNMKILCAISLTEKLGLGRRENYAKKIPRFLQFNAVKYADGVDNNYWYWCMRLHRLFLESRKEESQACQRSERTVFSH